MAKRRRFAADSKAKVALEALRSYKIIQEIAAPDMPNIREIVGDGDCALLFEPGDKAALNEALLKLRKDSTLRKKLAANATALIDKKGYTWRDNARRIAALTKPLLHT